LITVPLRPACRTLFPYTTLFRSEGWDFGEVSGNARFTQATQGQLGGTSIGTFNDRLRDAVHGGSPFDTDKRTNQGFGNGLSTMRSEEHTSELQSRFDLVCSLLLE